MRPELLRRMLPRLVSSLLLGAWGTLALVSSGWSQDAANSSDPLRWIESLEQRRLYRLAAEALDSAAAKTNDPDLIRRCRVRRLRVETAWAVEAAPDQRDEHWRQVQVLAARWLEGTTDPRDLALIGVQSALAQLARAEVLREEDLGGASRDAVASAAALEVIDEARKRLGEIDRAIPMWMSQRLPSGGRAWEAAEWLALSRNINFHLARCALERGHWYDQQVDRLEAFQDAAERLEGVARQTGADETLAWHTILARCRALREVGDLEGAARILIPPGTQESDEAWLVWLDAAPPELRARLVAERIRLAEQAKRTTEAAAWAVRGVEGQFGRAAELDLAILERLLARWVAEDSEDLETQAAAWARRIEQEHGTYWGRRAARTLVAKAAGQSTGNLDVVLSVADERTLQRRFPEAIQGYQAAIAAAKERGNAKLELTATLRLGAVLQAIGDYGRASEAFARAVPLAVQDSEQPRYAWLALWNRMQVVDASGDSEAASQLERELLDFEARFPERAEASEARVARVARLLRAGRSLEALEGTLNAAPTDPAQERLASLFAAAIELVIRSAADREASVEQRRQAADLLEQTYRKWNTEDQSEPSLSSYRLRLAVSLGRVLATLPIADASSDRVDGAIRWIDEELSRASDALDDAQRRQAELVAAVLGATGSLSGTAWQARLEVIGDTDAARLLEAIESLSARLRELDSDRRQRGAEFQLALLAKADALGPDQTAGRRRERCRVEALLALGRHEEAIEALRAILIAAPKDGEVQRWGARQWSEAGPNHRAGAIDQWRRVVARTPPRTDDWFEGKYRIAELTLASGDAARAVELLRFLKETPPGWEDAPQRDSFERLLKEAQQKTKQS